MTDERLAEIEEWFFINSPDIYASSMADELIAEVRRLRRLVPVRCIEPKPMKDPLPGDWEY